MGLLGDIGEFFEDAVDAVGGFAGDVYEAGASLFDGPGGIVGFFVAGGQLVVGGPVALIPAVVSGAAVAQGINALIKTRHMTDEERVLAHMVFGDTLLPYNKIVLANTWHPQGRAFVVPNPAGEAIMNLGDAYDDPIRHLTGPYVRHGQLFIHELTHVWQIANSSFVPGLVCEGILNQVKNELQDGVYEPGEGTGGWDDYNLEQQATIVDRWYRGWDQRACSPASAVYFQVHDHVNHGQDPPCVGPLGVAATAAAKFGQVPPFALSARLPALAVPSSLRNRLIGLES